MFMMVVVPIVVAPVAIMTIVMLVMLVVMVVATRAVVIDIDIVNVEISTLHRYGMDLAIDDPAMPPVSVGRDDRAYRCPQRASNHGPVSASHVSADQPAKRSAETASEYRSGLEVTRVRRGSHR